MGRLVAEPVAGDNAEHTTDEDRPTKCLSCGAEMPEDADVCPKCGWTYNQPAHDEAGGPEQAGEQEAFDDRQPE